ncbi:uncharacterized protein LOC108927782 isoform X1 [Arapaima gigas]
MLRRSFSFPSDAQWRRRLDRADCAARDKQNSWLTAWHAEGTRGHECICQWREHCVEEEQVTCFISGAEQLRFQENQDNNFEHEEDNMLDIQQLKEEDSILLNLSIKQRNDVITELIMSKNRLKKMNEDLQKSLDIAEDFNTCLHSENMELKNQIQSMKHSMQEAEQLTDELEVLQSCLAQREAAIAELETCVKLLEKEIKTLREQHESFSIEICSILPEREMDKKKLFGLISHLRGLQQQMEETTMALEQKNEVIHKKDFVIEQLESSLNEYSYITQDLKKKIKDLEFQLTEASINPSSGGFQFFDGTFCPPVTNCVSLAEELQLWPPPGEQRDHSFKECPENREMSNSLSRSPTARLGHVQISLWQVWHRRIKSVLGAAAVICLCFLVPLILLWTIIPPPCGTIRLTCTDVLSNVVCRLVCSYCSGHQFSQKPF